MVQSVIAPEGDTDDFLQDVVCNLIILNFLIKFEGFYFLFFYSIHSGEI